MSLDFNARDEDGNTDSSALRYLLGYARPFWKEVSLGILFLILQAVSGVAFARYLGVLVDQGLAAKNHDLIVKMSVLIVGLEAFGIVFAYFGRRTLAFAASKSILRIRYDLFSHLQHLPMAYFDKQPQGRTVTRVTHDVEGLEEFFSGTMARLLQALISMSSVVVAMIVTDRHLGFILVMSMIPALLVTIFSRTTVRHWNREFARLNSSINAKLSEFLNGLPVIRTFAAEDWSMDEYGAVVSQYRHAAVQLNVVNSYLRPLVLVLCTAPLLVLLWFGGHRVIAGTLELGLFITFVRYSERFARPVSALAQEIHTIQTAFTSAERVTAFLKHPMEHHSLGKNGETSAAHIRGEVEFKNLSMGYDPERPVLNDVSFRATAGTHIGLAGTTGSGKTTTVALLARLYDYQSGDILIDGQDIRRYDRHSLRDQMGFVSQDVVIFRGTLRENLLSGTPMTDDKIHRACAQTGLSRIMQRSQLNLQSEILDHGSNLSVGERQLLALTRVLIKNPSLLVLDEATANVDPEFEEIIHRAVNLVMKNRTCFIIAHRISTLRNCDQILVFKNGKIIERGNDQELVNARGYYASLVQGKEIIDDPPTVDLT